MLLNVREVGYFKVNYDKKNWGMLIDQLQRDHTVIHTANRAQVRRIVRRDVRRTGVTSSVIGHRSSVISHGQPAFNVCLSFDDKNWTNVMVRSETPRIGISEES